MKPCATDVQAVADAVSACLSDWHAEVGVCVYSPYQRKWMRQEFDSFEFGASLLRNASILHSGTFDLAIYQSLWGFELKAFPVYSMVDLDWFCLSPTGLIKDLSESAKALRAYERAKLARDELHTHERAKLARDTLHMHCIGWA